MTHILVGRNGRAGVSLDPHHSNRHGVSAGATGRPLGKPSDQHTEAMQLLDPHAAAWPEHPRRADIEPQRHQPAGPA